MIIEIKKGSKNSEYEHHQQHNGSNSFLHERGNQRKGTRRVSPCSNEAFIRRYCEYDTEFEDNILKKEFGLCL